MKEELTGMLVEYSLCKEVAARLRAMGEGVYLAVRAPHDGSAGHHLPPAPPAVRAGKGLPRPCRAKAC